MLIAALLYLAGAFGAWLLVYSAGVLSSASAPYETNDTEIQQ